MPLIGVNIQRNVFMSWCLVVMRVGKEDCTGEWIVFAEVDDVKYDLTLGTHTEGDAAVFERVKACAVEFPEIMVQS